MQKFFPANYCEEINYVAEEEAKNNKYENGVDEQSVSYCHNEQYNSYYGIININGFPLFRCRQT